MICESMLCKIDYVCKQCSRGLLALQLACAVGLAAGKTLEHRSDDGRRKAATPHHTKLNSKLLQAAHPVQRAATTAKRDLFPVRV